jgi:alpha-methylacyl-CoA racemase
MHPTQRSKSTGPLQGLKVIEFAGVGPAPFCGMLLSDLGAEVVRIERQGSVPFAREDIVSRGRHSIALDLKQPASIEFCLQLIDAADMLFEGFRPGVMERLGLGPEVALARKPSLIYGRVTGWGQHGPKAEFAGHDINYLAISGALNAIGTQDKPLAPLNLAADYGGGALFLAVGLLAATLHARATGVGQVVDAAMCDGAAYLATLFHGLLARGQWQEGRASNALDGGAPFYDTYQCADGKWIAIGALEPQFYALLIKLTGISPQVSLSQTDRLTWPAMRAAFVELFASRTRQHWCEIFEQTDACFARTDGVTHPAPAPRFSQTPAAVRWPAARNGEEVAATLKEWGVSPQTIPPPPYE